MGADTNKVYLPLAGRRVLSWSLDAFGAVPEIGVLVLVVRAADRGLVEAMLDREPGELPVEIVTGGASRQESELRALRRLASRIDAGAVDTVLLHDAARPLVSPALITGVLRAAREYGGAVPGLPAEELVAVGAGGALAGEPALTAAIRVQTPQGFRAPALLDAYERAAREEFLGTDTSSCVERYSRLPVRWVPGERHNLKLTYPHDLPVAEHYLRNAARSR